MNPISLLFYDHFPGGDLAGQCITLDPQEHLLWRVGRGRGSLENGVITINDQHFSAIHVTLSYDAHLDQWMIFDGGIRAGKYHNSRNGAYLNGAQLERRTRPNPEPIDVDDCIQLTGSPDAKIIVLADCDGTMIEDRWFGPQWPRLKPVEPEVSEHEPIPPSAEIEPIEGTTAMGIHQLQEVGNPYQAGLFGLVRLFQALQDPERRWGTVLGVILVAIVSFGLLGVYGFFRYTVPYLLPPRIESAE